MLIGLISDTHDLLRRRALDELESVDAIIHCGDFCAAEILAALAALAPLHAVRGNCDLGEWARALPLRDFWTLGGVTIYGVHAPGDLDLDPRAAGIRLVVHGHTHEPRDETIDGVRYVNPGSAGPRRFGLPISMARLEIADAVVDLRWVALE